MREGINPHSLIRTSQNRKTSTEVDHLFETRLKGVISAFTQPQGPEGGSRLSAANGPLNHLSNTPPGSRWSFPGFVDTGSLFSALLPRSNSLN